MRQQGLDTSGDHVYPDLAFGLAVPPAGPGDERTVGIGLMDYQAATTTTAAGRTRSAPPTSRR